MARKRKWASEAERLAAYRAKRTETVRIGTDSKRTDSAQVEAETVKPKPVSVPDAKTEQWRLDAQRYMATGKLPKVPAPSPGFVAFKDCPDVPHDPKAPPWLGAGRGVVREYKGKSYVLVARHRGPLDVDALEHGVVTAQDHAARLDQRCEHKRAGWACHAC